MSHHVKTIQHRIATLAEYHAKEGLSSIHHHLDKWWLAEAYRELKPNKAPGMDGVSKAEYGEGLSQRLEDLVNRVRKREYRAPNIKRVMIPKGNGEFRRERNLFTEEPYALILLVRFCGGGGEKSPPLPGSPQENG
jgi:hypothetical protein